MKEVIKMENILLAKITTHGKLLETIKSTEAQMEYMHYLYNNKFYRIAKHIDKIIWIVKIPKSYISEWGQYHINH